MSEWHRSHRRVATAGAPHEPNTPSHTCAKMVGTTASFVVLLVLGGRTKWTIFLPFAQA